MKTKYIFYPVLFAILFFSGISFSQINFDEYFLDKTLRLDYFHTGNKENDSYSFDELLEEPYWGGSKVNLVDTLNLGRYEFIVHDLNTGKVIFSKGYSTLFNEWQTTEEAKHTTRTLSETITFPYPKHPVKVEFYSRNRLNEPVKKFEYQVDPESYFIKTERKEIFDTINVVVSGDPAVKVDIVIIPDGYTQEEMEKFKSDCERFAGYLFNCSPFKENKDKFNIRGVLAPSKDSGTDIPADDVWKNTIVNTTFYTFDLERYLMTTDNKILRDIASNVPYDQIYILVNSDKYGGGSIYNLYSVCTSDNKFGEFTFTHEFGHGFAFLADEYYTSDVAYQDFYPLEVEPLEPNITTLVNFESKWKDLVNEDTPVPTPAIAEYKNKVGAFEGGGYVEKGVYRPMQDCTMKSIVVDNFCPVCKRAIKNMIDFYTK